MTYYLTSFSYLLWTLKTTQTKQKKPKHGNILIFQGYSRVSVMSMFPVLLRFLLNYSWLYLDTVQVCLACRVCDAPEKSKYTWMFKLIHESLGGKTLFFAVDSDFDLKASIYDQLKSCYDNCSTPDFGAEPWSTSSGQSPGNRSCI